MAIADSEMLTVAEVAQLLKLNQQTVRNWIDAGKLTAVRVGRRVRVQRSVLEEFMGVDLKSEARRDEPDQVAPLVLKTVLLEALEQTFDREAAAVALDQIAAGCSALARTLRGRP